MANICTNMFYFASEQAESIQRLSEFLDAHFEWWCNDGDTLYLEGEFDSKWAFPEELFADFIAEQLSTDETLYLRILSYEFGCEYASFRVYSEQAWRINF